MTIRKGQSSGRRWPSPAPSAPLRPATDTRLWLSVLPHTGVGREETGRSGILNLIHGSVNGLTAAGDEVRTADRLPQKPVGLSFGVMLHS